MIGFSLRWDGQQHGTFWITGDTVLYRGVLEVVERISVEPVLLHLGCVRFGVTGPLRYTMTAEEAVQLLHALRPTTAIPVHYEGWSHFQQGKAAIERVFSAAPEGVPRTIRWVPIGRATEVEA